MTEQAERDAVKNGTKYERCDYCPSWLPLSTARVMGWCTRQAPKPSVPSVSLLMESAPGDPITTYNQACGHFNAATT